MISTMSMRQALLVWSELEQAFYGDNGFGGDTAEIYAYTLVEDSPSAHAGDDTSRRDQACNAAESLQAVLRMFKNLRPCKVYIDGGLWRGGMISPIDHRVHVRILAERDSVERRDA